MCLVRHACYLVCVSVGVSDSRHEADSPFHAITKVSRILDASAVLMMSIKKVNEAHHHDPMLETSKKKMGDQVMEKMASPWKHRSLSPNKIKHIVQEKTLVVMRERERVGFIRTSNSTHLFLTFRLKPSCRGQHVVKDAQEPNGKLRTRGTGHKFHVRQNVSATR